MNRSLLQGVRVIDFGRYIAGPYAGWLLATLGAEVIRIEKFGGSEDRFVSPLFHNADGSDGDGAMYYQNNSLKKIIGLNPKSEQGQKIQRQLIASADVVLANMPEDGLKKMGIDYASLKAIKPDIIFTWVTALGSEGPWAHKAGFDGIAQAMAGSMFFTGTPGHPVKTSAPYVDNSTAMTAAMGTLAALWHKEKTGEGQLVEASLLASAVSIFAPMLCEQGATQINRQPNGSRSQTSGPSDVFKTRDGHVIVHVVGNALFKRLAKALGKEAWLNDESLNSDNKRGQNRDRICEEIQPWFLARSNEEVLDILGEMSVPAGPVLNMQEAIDHPQVKGMNLQVKVNAPELKFPAPLSRAPFRLEKTEIKTPEKPAAIGQHTEEVLLSLGYSKSEIKNLKAEGHVE